MIATDADGFRADWTDFLTGATTDAGLMQNRPKTPTIPYRATVIHQGFLLVQ